MNVRLAEKTDEARWRDLWKGYCEFYKMDLSENVTSYLWERILNPDNKSVFSVVTEDPTKRIVGIANCVLHESTSSPALICCLQDLFVDPPARNQGVGKALIDWLIAEMKLQKWSRIYWHTRENNYRARALYDKVTPLNDFRRYVVTNSSI